MVLPEHLLHCFGRLVYGGGDGYVFRLRRIIYIESNINGLESGLRSPLSLQRRQCPPPGPRESVSQRGSQAPVPIPRSHLEGHVQACRQ